MLHALPSPTSHTEAAHVAEPATPTVSLRSPAWRCTGHGASSVGLLAEQEPPPSGNSSARRKLWIVAGLSVLFMAGEVSGGLLANSLAILTDAAHLLSDFASFLISLAALYLANRSPTSELSFGFHRAEILGALTSVLIIWLLTGVLLYEAVLRLISPQEVDGMIMFIVAASGLAVNVLMGLVLHQSGHAHSHGLGGGDGGHAHSPAPAMAGATGVPVRGAPSGDSGREDEELKSAGEVGARHLHSPRPTTEVNINVRAAFIHVLGDALQSCGVIIAAIIIWVRPEWHIADPICTFLFSIIVLFTTTRLLKQILVVLMEGVPQGVNPVEVEKSLQQVPGVLGVHDLHIWSLSVGKPCLSVHLLVADDSHSALKSAHGVLSQAHNIYHSTIQVESELSNMQC